MLQRAAGARPIQTCTKKITLGCVVQSTCNKATKLEIYAQTNPTYVRRGAGPDSADNEH